MSGLAAGALGKVGAKKCRFFSTKKNVHHAMLLRAAQFYLKQITGKLVSEISQDDIQVYLSIGQLENKSGTLKRSCVVL